jgi:hypothetical protein
VHSSDPKYINNQQIHFSIYDVHILFKMMMKTLRIKYVIDTEVHLLVIYIFWKIHYVCAVKISLLETFMMISNYMRK